MYSEKYRRNVPILDVFDDIMKIIEDPSEKARKFKKELLGENIIETAPPEYWELGMLESLHIPLHFWEQMSAHQQAKIRARYRLSNIASIIQRYFELKKEALERAMRKSKSG